VGRRADWAPQVPVPICCQVRTRQLRPIRTHWSGLVVERRADSPSPPTLQKSAVRRSFAWGLAPQVPVPIFCQVRTRQLRPIRTHWSGLVVKRRADSPSPPHFHSSEAWSEPTNSDPSALTGAAWLWGGGRIGLRRCLSPFATHEDCRKGESPSWRCAIIPPRVVGCGKWITRNT
jgi:hypothetical protein